MSPKAFALIGKAIGCMLVFDVLAFIAGLTVMALGDVLAGAAVASGAALGFAGTYKLAEIIFARQHQIVRN